MRRIVGVLWLLIWISVSSPVLAEEMLGPKGRNAEAIAGIFWLVVAVCMIIFLVVGITLATFIVRFRERVDDGKTEPPQLYGSEPIEVAWTLAPAMVVLVIGLVTVRSVIDLKHIPSGTNTEKIRVVGHQWWWEFEYPGYGFTTANEMVIPVSTETRPRNAALQLESADVIHSFWVPTLAGKTDNVPGKTNRMWIDSNVPGTYFGRCAEYCGTQHTKMLFRVDVVSEEAYREWVANQSRPAVNDPSVAEGRKLFLTMACANCHTVRGTRAKGLFGPDLTHFMSRKTIGSGVIENNPENLTGWLLDPDKYKLDCYMPDMRLGEKEAQQISEYLQTLE